MRKVDNHILSAFGACMFSKPVWYLRQLLPLTYRSHYSDSEGQQYFSVWQMWFGKVFNHTAVKVID